MSFSWWRKSKREEELREEVREHLEMAKQDRVERGESAKEAERAVRREFGNVELVKETARDQWRWKWATEIAEDVRFGLRMMRKNPGFTSVAVLTLALGIGANTAIFSLIDAAFLRGIPVRDGNRLVLFQWKAQKSPGFEQYMGSGYCISKVRGADAHGCSFSVPFFNELQKQGGSGFSGLAAFTNAGVIDLAFDKSATIVNEGTQAVSGDYFETLGIKPELGRLLNAADDTPDGANVVVLSYKLWRTNFASNPSIVGQTVRINKVPCVVVGVTEKEFTSLNPGEELEMWVPLSLRPRLSEHWDSRERDSRAWWVAVVGKLQGGASQSQAEAETSMLFYNAMLHGDKPMSKAADKPAMVLAGLQEGFAGNRRDYGTPLQVMMLAVGIVLLIACANVAGLMLSRAAARQREIAVRFALGATRGRILRQLLTESLLLSIAGGTAGVVLASWCLVLIGSFARAVTDDGLPFHPAINLKVLLFTGAVSIVAGMIFGMVPTLMRMKLNLVPALKEGVGGSAQTRRPGREWLNAGNGLVVAQIALSIVVLAGAGLLVRTLQNLRHLSPGFDTRNVLTFSVDPTLIGYKRADIDNLYRELNSQLAGMPGVVSASYSWQALLGGGWFQTGFHADGTPKEQQSTADFLPIGPNFFHAMRIPLLGGREFLPEDFAQAEIAAQADIERFERAAAKLKGGASAETKAEASVEVPPIPALVNRTFVRRYFPNGDLLGRVVGKRAAIPEKSISEQPGWRIVGIVGDAKYDSLRREIEPTVYIPNSAGSVSFVLRTETDPEKFVPQVRAAVNRLDSNLPIFEVHTESQQIDQQLAKEELVARLSSVFGGLALVLACVGLYGLVSYEVARQTREIGIRAALGAARGDVLRLVLTQGMRLALVGTVFGVGLGLMLMRYLKDLLYGVKTADPTTFVVAAVLLLTVTLLASYVPAQRAMKVDPVVALRYE
ncbi:MAG TPA: ABC transporter permease [Candidatus Acidoferrum sp.]